MTPGDRAKQRAIVLSQVTINSVVFNRYDLYTYGAETGHVTFRNSLGIKNVADDPVFDPRLMTVLIENGSNWITTYGIIRRNTTGANGQEELLVRADGFNVVGSSQGTPPSGFTVHSSLTTVANICTISITPSAGALADLSLSKGNANYGALSPKLWPYNIATLSSEEEARYGFLAQEFPTDLNDTGTICVGFNAAATGKRAIAIGSGAEASAKTNIAIGANAQCRKVGSVAIGIGVQAYNYNSWASGLADMYFPINAGYVELTQVEEVIRFQTGTTDATPKAIGAYDPWPTPEVPFANSEKIYVDAGITKFECFFTATNIATEEMKVWSYVFYVKNTNAYGVAATFGTPVKTVIASDSNTATWDISYAINQPTDELTFSVTGAASKDILWMATITQERHSAWIS